jgi:hypothetical protein
MTVFNPVWRVKIQGVEYTTYTLSNLTITSGRNNIYQQAQAGYCNLELLNLTQAIVNIHINDSVTIELKDSTDTFVPIFGGTVVDFGIEVNTAGSIAINQILTITALGALSRLPKALTDGILAQDFDGDQIWEVLQDLLLNNWGEVPAALQWNNYDPTETWANAQNVGLGEIDRPGNYELAARSSNRTDIYSLVAALATSGLGYIYEDASGLISYADSTHRSIYLATYGYTDVTANQALFNGLKIQTRAGDVRNDIALKYGTNSNNEVSAEDINSIDIYGRLAQQISTTVKHQADAQDQADFYLTLRATPQANFESITFQLTNPELDDTDRDSLINVFMGLPLRISDLPQNMASGTFLGFVEGWSFKAAYNEIAITLNLSPISFSLQAMKWEDVSVLEQWNTISGSLTWETALVVA